MGTFAWSSAVWTIVLILLVGLSSGVPTTQKDAVGDAVRQAAEKAVKEGKHEDAVVLLTKLVEAAGAKYQDWLMLGRANEKLNHNREAIAAYRKVLEVVPEMTDKRDERSARTEARQRLTTLDVMGGKVEQFAKDTEKKVLDIIRDADKAQDWETAGRLMKLYVELRQIRGDTQVVYFEVQANKAMQRTGFAVVQGRAYRIRALGRWRLSPRIECTADGTSQVPAGFHGPAGALLVGVVKSATEYKNSKAGSDVTWVAPLSGELLFTINDQKIGDPAGKEKYTGSLHVLIERVD